MFPFNRIGGIRGEGGATLDDLLAALQAQASGAALLNAINDLNVNLQTLIDYTGAPLDTACNLTQTQLLCSILGVLGETGETPGAPPASCPGFPPNPEAWILVTQWYEPSSVAIGPLGYYTAVLNASGGPAGLSVVTVTPDAGEPDFHFDTLRTNLDATNICIAYDKAAEGFTLYIDTFDIATGNILSSSPITGAEASTGVGSDPENFDTDEYIVLRVSSVAGALTEPPALTVWITRGAQG